MIIQTEPRMKPEFIAYIFDFWKRFQVFCKMGMLLDNAIECHHNSRLLQLERIPITSYFSHCSTWSINFIWFPTREWVQCLVICFIGAKVALTNYPKWARSACPLPSRSSLQWKTSLGSWICSSTEFDRKSIGFQLADTLVDVCNKQDVAISLEKDYFPNTRLRFTSTISRMVKEPLPTKFTIVCFYESSCRSTVVELSCLSDESYPE